MREEKRREKARRMLKRYITTAGGSESSIEGNYMVSVLGEILKKETDPEIAVGLAGVAGNLHMRRIADVWSHLYEMTYIGKSMLISKESQKYNLNEALHEVASNLAYGYNRSLYTRYSRTIADLFTFGWSWRWLYEDYLSRLREKSKEIQIRES